jgi:hypothetical protein
MTTEYLTIKEAAEKYQKAEITMRRLVRSIVQAAQHEDRDLVKPAPAQANKLKKLHKPFTYSISQQLLEKRYGAGAGAETAPAEEIPKKEVHNQLSELLLKTNDQLSDQLKVKDDQIRALTQTLDDLSERQRETNILMKGLQENCSWKLGKKSGGRFSKCL